MLTQNTIFRTFALLIGLSISPLAVAQLSLADSPLFVGSRATPMVMLNTSRDHQLFYKAYNDYTDIDGNGTLDSYETTYLNSFDYYGYFDSYKCYTYSTTKSRFEPTGAASGSPTDTAPALRHYCTGAWSGNFLNWLAMSRLDVMRKVLYGGYRSTDAVASSSASSSIGALTVLERANIPTDAHAWAKYYNGTDVHRLTPFTGVLTAAPTGTITVPSTVYPTRAFNATVVSRKPSSPRANAITSATVLVGDFAVGHSVTFSHNSGASTTTGTVISYVASSGLLTITPTAKVGADAAVGEAVTVTNNSITASSTLAVTMAGNHYAGDQISITNGSRVTYGVVSATTSSGTVNLVNLAGRSLPTGTTLTLKNETRVGISFCNATVPAVLAGAKSETTNAPPYIRAAKGNYSLWAANERWQCFWRDEGKNATNSNQYADSGIPANSIEPSKGETGLSDGGVFDLVARVEVCRASLLGQESCKQYGENYKPAGLLQNYGEGRVPRILFGLMTPSYTLNVSGGVLRKAINKSLSGNVAADGVSADAANDEINPDTGVFNTNIAQPGGTGIIYTLNKLRIDNYQYSDGTYAGCTFQRTGIVPTGTATSGNQVSEGSCSSWGNPMSELYMETMRYLSGNPATAAFTRTLGMDRDNQVGLKQVTPWVDPITSTNYCAPLNVLVFNASVSTNDGDQVGGFSALSGSPSAVTRTNEVGAAEGLVGKSAFIGNNGSTSNGICTAKTVASLGTLGGICPEAPSQAGTYLMAGMAYHAHVNRIRSGTPFAMSSADTTSLRVNTYGVALATNVPRIPVVVSGKTVYIQPAYRLDLGTAGVGTGAIVDFRVVSQDATKGTFYVNWEDSNFGGDYDQDVIGTISYEIISATQIRITTKVIGESTEKPQGFGYVISGTTRDGPHFHSGIEGFNFTDPTGALGCSNCQQANLATSVLYDVVGSTAIVELKDPLYYAAKYGGFKEFTSDGKPTTIAITSLPDQVVEWDSQKTDGTAGSDGLPDNYFYVNNPAQLEKSLAAAFKAISQSSGGAAVATSSTSLDTGTTVFQGVFDPGYWTGDLRAFDLKLVSGSFVFTKQWSAAEKLTSASGRVIFTNNPSSNVGIPFTWGSLSTAQQNSLELVSHPSAPTDQGVLDYVRGSSSREGAGVNSFRVRDTTKLGDIINSAPVMVNTPGTYGAVTSVPVAYSGDSTYSAFAPSRSSLIYVGANDGMLHAFDSTTGAERFAYIPSMVIPNLKNLVNPAYTHKYFVDGSPVAADAKLTVSGSPAWRTVLTGALRAGGRGLYALDVTAPDYSSEATAKDTLLWEFTPTHETAGLTGMGYVFERPIVTRLRGGQWAVVVGNGYNSAAGTAQLFIIYLDQKGVAAPQYLKINTAAGGPSDPNGLGGVAGIDTDGDGNVDYVYGGDLKGNLWKFDLTGHVANDAASVTVGKLAVACIDATATCSSTRLQPITSTPALSTHPTNSRHVLVYFGTGKYFETSDASSTQQQSMYGVWDKTVDTGGATIATTLQTRNQLLVQTITNDASGSFRQLTDLPIDWTTHAGWVENLPDSGERITGTPLVFNRGVIYNTFVPAALQCGTTAGYGWLMAVNFMTGGVYGAFDINGDGTIEDTELAAGKRTTTIGGSTLATGAGGLIVAIGNSVTGDVSATGFKCVGSHCTTPPGGGGGGTPNRLSWREIIKPE